MLLQPLETSLLKDTIERGPDEPGNPPNNVAQRLVPRFIHASNDEVERRGVAPTQIETDLSQSSIPSLAHRRRAPRSLEPIVRFPTAPPSKQLLQLFTRELEITQDACQEPWTKCFAGVNRNHRGAAVAVTHEVMTSLNSYHNKSNATQCRDKILALNSREGGHAPTVTRCTPTKSSASGGLP